MIRKCNTNRKKNEGNTFDIGIAQPFSGDQSREGLKSLQRAQYDLPSPTGGCGNSICRHEPKEEAFLIMIILGKGPRDAAGR